MTKKDKDIILPTGILILVVGIAMILINQFLIASIDGLESFEFVGILGGIITFIGAGVIVASHFRK